jgi:transposase
MREKIENIINGLVCPKCGFSRLYRLSDYRYKCKSCSFKYSAARIKRDFEVLHYFSLEIPAHKTSKDLGCDYGAVRQKYMGYRHEIYANLVEEFRRLAGEIECDESYFGGRRKGPRRRGASGKIRVFGMLERNGRIITTVIDDVSAETIMSQIKAYAKKGSVFYTDQFKSYKSLRFWGKHLAIDHGQQFANGKSHINGLEGFWSFAKERLLKYHGVSKTNFLYYLKEMEFRYNHRKENIFDLLCKIHFSPENH